MSAVNSNSVDILNAADLTHPNFRWCILLLNLNTFYLYFSLKEHYYDGESGTGYLAWRVKTIQRGLAKDRHASFEGTL